MASHDFFAVACWKHQNFDSQSMIYAVRLFRAHTDGGFLLRALQLDIRTEYGRGDAPAAVFVKRTPSGV
jgi:hypothetical protein